MELLSTMSDDELLDYLEEFNKKVSCINSNCLAYLRVKFFVCPANIKMLHCSKTFQHSNPRSTIDIDCEDQKKLWLTLLELIEDPTKTKCHGSLLNASKILT